MQPQNERGASGEASKLTQLETGHKRHYRTLEGELRRVLERSAYVPTAAASINTPIFRNFS